MNINLPPDLDVNQLVALDWHASVIQHEHKFTRRTKPQAKPKIQPIVTRPENAAVLSRVNEVLMSLATDDSHIEESTLTELRSTLKSRLDLHFP